MPRSRTTQLTLFVGSADAPVVYRATLFSDGLFRRLGSNVIIDFGDDPGTWECWTSDHVMRLASDDSEDGFQISKGVVSRARLMNGVARSNGWKVTRTIAAMLGAVTRDGKHHPLVGDVLTHQLRSEWSDAPFRDVPASLDRDVWLPLETIRAAYARYRQLMSGEDGVMELPEA